MRTALLFLAIPVSLVALVACPPPQPVPPAPDADASPVPPPPVPGPEASPPSPEASPVPTTPCQAACDALRVAGCAEGIPSDCVRVLANIESSRMVREPSGKPLTCADVATITSKSGARALGLACGN